MNKIFKLILVMDFKMIPHRIIRSLSLIFVLMLITSGYNFALAHGGNYESDDHYQVPYNEGDVSMRLSNIQIPLGESFETNVSVTPINSSMTVIVEVARNGGTVWGLYFEKQSTYFEAKNGTIDPRIFCSTGLSQCCTKIFDHVSYYAAEHITRTIGDDYVIALYNTHFHDEDTTIFDVIILKGHIGEEVFILTPPNDNSLVSILVLTLVIGIGIFSISLVTYVLVIKPKQRLR